MNTTTQLTIKTLDGAEHHINIQHTSYTSRTVAELVEQELHCAPSQYRLIPSPTSRDTYILVPLRHKEPSNAVDNSVHKGPSNEAIAQATSHFTSSQSSTNVQPAVIQELEGQIRGLLTRLSGPAEPAPLVLHEDSIARLQEMGFTHEQVTAALTQANGNEMLAASYLLGDTDSDLEDEIQEARDEPLHALQLDPQQVINTLFSNPNFLQGVNDPSVLAALQHILAEPSALEDYLNDEQIGPLLVLLYNSLQQ
jgi:hypothetical protein